MGPLVDTTASDTSFSSTATRKHSEKRWIVSMLTTALCLLLAILVADAFRLNSLNAAVAHFKGRVAMIEQIESTTEDENDLLQTTAKVHVRNLRVRELTIRGARTNCVCTVVDGVPVTIAGACVSNLIVRVSGQRGQAVRQDIALFFDGMDDILEFSVDVGRAR